MTVHDLRHLAATITVTAGVPLTVVSKTLRHSTLSTTANVYSHLTQQAAREAVDTIDHIQHLHEALNRLRSPAPTGFHPTANQPQSGRATTMRPPVFRAWKRPPSHARENGLRPA
ncbi:tyrosine-type recombinase/integrase [Streptomyces sp. NBC_00091]|nr:tyrosine-type recombinase/integrase [Streptomyces sp. NBC_00091]MCX5381469.1 tyrosine-type recombinase/integrase [Streptomyces sp. NBC_00091]